MTPYKGLINALDLFVAQEKRDVLDALACELHNDGHFLSGNTEANDTAWFAEWLHRVWAEDSHKRTAWNHLEEEDRRQWFKLAKLVISALPFLMERISNRYLAMASALRMLEKSETEKYFAMKQDIDLKEMP